jgi:DNA-binding HxlR family transcriptional regulator
MTPKTRLTADDELRLTTGVGTALEVIGGKWKLLILANLVGGTRRYGELKRAIPAASEKVLIQQLRELEADGLIQRVSYPEVPPRVEYSFTEYGRSICTVIQTLFEWGNQHAASQRTTASVS